MNKMEMGSIQNPSQEVSPNAKPSKEQLKTSLTEIDDDIYGLEVELENLRLHEAGKSAHPLYERKTYAERGKIKQDTKLALQELHQKKDAINQAMRQAN